MMATRPITIGFDVRPGASGPGRYVASLVRGMDPGELMPVFVDVLETPSDSPLNRASETTACTLNQAPEPIRKRSHRAARFVPRGVRLWGGFFRESQRIARVLRR